MRKWEEKKTRSNSDVYLNSLTTATKKQNNLVSQLSEIKFECIDQCFWNQIWDRTSETCKSWFNHTWIGWQINVKVKNIWKVKK